MTTTLSTRSSDIEEFLQSFFIQELQSYVPLQGDAGLRSYYRIKANNNSYIFMDCPPTYCSIEPFIKIGHFLRSHNFSTPEIFHFDIQKGFIILEDLGDLNVKKFIQNSLNDLHSRKNIYYLMIDILLSLQEKIPDSDLKIYDNNLLMNELKLFVDWYIPYRLKRSLSNIELEEFQNIWQGILNKQIPFKNCLVLRDYHVENIMYLENYKGINSLGLLDFQDAVIGSPIYDLVSLLEDARIEVPREFAIECIKYFATQKKLELNDVLTNYHIMGAQRNSRILGVFTRKFIRDKNEHYLQYIPLVLEYLNHDLSHPVMIKLKHWFDKVIN